MAKAKKRSTMAKKVVAKKVAPVKEAKYTFIARDKSGEKTLTEPVKDNKASQVLFDVLGRGVMPEGLRLQFAQSYDATFIARKGKNALGSSKAQNMLVVTGIADELEKAGVAGICTPTKKPYKAIRLGGHSPAQLRELATTIAQVLGITKEKKAVVKAKAVEAAKA
jgi:hypothetical protein